MEAIKTFFIIMGVIFTALLFFGAFMWWITEDFADDGRAAKNNSK